MVRAATATGMDLADTAPQACVAVEVMALGATATAAAGSRLSCTCGGADERQQ